MRVRCKAKRTPAALLPPRLLSERRAGDAMIRDPMVRTDIRHGLILDRRSPA